MIKIEKGKVIPRSLLNKEALRAMYQLKPGESFLVRNVQSYRQFAYVLGAATDRRYTVLAEGDQLRIGRLA